MLPAVDEVDVQLLRATDRIVIVVVLFIGLDEKLIFTVVPSVLGGVIGGPLLML